jgi:hypothetical protein
LRHGTPPRTHAPLSRNGADGTPEAWRKGDGGLPKLSSGIPVGAPACKRALYQMLSASNVTRPMPPNSAARATESYSSQYRCVCMMPPTVAQFLLVREPRAAFFHLCPGALPATAIVGEWVRAAAQEQNSRGGDLVPIEPRARLCNSSSLNPWSRPMWDVARLFLSWGESRPSI